MQCTNGDDRPTTGRMVAGNPRSRARGWARFVTVAVAVALLATVTACGSRASGSDGAASGNGLGTTGSTSGGPTSTGGSDTSKFGTIANPCSATKATGAAATATPGVTDSTIKIGVISDKKNAITPVPTIGIEESTKAFVDYCNANGGINGRKLVLKTYDAQIAQLEGVTKSACDAGLFALVGDGAVLDQQGITTREKCGLPEIAAYSATPERSSSKDFFQGVPGTLPAKFNVGPCRYIAGKFPDAVTKAAVVYVNLGASAARALATAEACEKEGFKFVAKIPVDFGVKDYKPVVSEMKGKGVKYLTVVSVVPETTALLREMKQQDVKVDVLDLGQQYYDEALLQEPTAEGAFVLTNTTPFSETDSTPALKTYTEWLTKVGNVQPTSLGVQAFSAGMLFATATKTLGNSITRAGLVAAVKNITKWDGGGLQMEADPGGNVQNTCFLYLQVTDAKFERAFPDKGFDCDPSYLASIAPHTATNP